MIDDDDNDDDDRLPSLAFGSLHLRGVWIRQYGCFFGKSPKGGGGSFPIQKITLQIFLVLKRYILVVNFGKNVQKGGGGVISNPKKIIANFCKLTYTYEKAQ